MTSPVRRAGWSALLVLLSIGSPDGSDAQRSVSRSASSRTAAPETTTDREVRFLTRSGTWMSVDVSPDGRTVVFDLLGDLYDVPITGGRARRLTSGSAFDAQPRFAPDGRSIVFTSDRDGAHNVWVARADGTAARALTSARHAQFASPAWSADGRTIFVSRDDTYPAVSHYGLVAYDLRGGSGVPILGPAALGAPVQPSGDNVLGAAPSPDGRRLYASVKRGPYQSNLLLPSWQIVVRDQARGEVRTAIEAFGSAMRPTLSPDGRWLVYATRRDTSTALRLHDLRTGAERWLLAEDVTLAPARDDQESRFTRDLMPAMAFTPDSRELVLTLSGGLWRVPIETGRPVPIPFEAEVTVRLPAPAATGVRPQAPRDDGSARVVSRPFVRDARLSPDGTLVAFVALDRVWVAPLGAGDSVAGPARRVREVGEGPASAGRRGGPWSLLAAEADGEFAPAWSPDGRWLAFTTWGDEGGGVWRVAVAHDADGVRIGPARPLAPRGPFYDRPVYTPDCSSVVLVRAPERMRRAGERRAVHGEAHGEVHGEVHGAWLHAEQQRAPGGDEPLTAMELVAVRLDSGGGLPAVRRLASLREPTRPHFTHAAPGRVYYRDGADGLVSVGLDGSGRQAHLAVTGFRPAAATGAPVAPMPADDIVIAPDGRHVVAHVHGDLWLLAAPPPFAPPLAVNVLEAQRGGAALAGRRLGRAGGEGASWSSDGAELRFAAGDALHVLGVRTLLDAGAADATTGDAPLPRRVRLPLSVASGTPAGTLVLRNARLLTMRRDSAGRDEIIPRGDVVVRDGRIVALGAVGDVSIPGGARELDLAGRTVMPGWVDAHYHMPYARDVHERQPWPLLATLAFGVTTVHDPQSVTTDVLTYADRIAAGDMIGPRILTTGPGVFWWDDITSGADARAFLRRYWELYGTATLKQYMSGNRQVRQWVAAAAREAGLHATVEGGVDFQKNLTEVLDGYAGIEHTLPTAPLYDDVITLLARSGVVYTPALLVSYGGPYGEGWFYATERPSADERLRRFTPPDVLAATTRRRTWFDGSQHFFRAAAREAARIAAAGGVLAVGSHGQLQGLGYHWELWALASGGMPLMDVLRAGTVGSARAAARAHDIGMLAPGMRADLQVLDADPLADIRNTRTVRYVMSDGRLYDARTVAQLWPSARAAPRLRW